MTRSRAERAPSGERTPYGRRSAGLLIAANAGTPVKAIADGIVVYGEWMTAYGLFPIVDHGGGTLIRATARCRKTVGAHQARRRGRDRRQIRRSWAFGPVLLAASQRLAGQSRIDAAALIPTRAAPRFNARF